MYFMYIYHVAVEPKGLASPPDEAAEKGEILCPFHHAVSLFSCFCCTGVAARTADCSEGPLDPGGMTSRIRSHCAIWPSAFLHIADKILSRTIVRSSFLKGSVGY
jgi:hypothetical protein